MPGPKPVMFEIEGDVVRIIMEQKTIVRETMSSGPRFKLFLPRRFNPVWARLNELRCPIRVIIEVPKQVIEDLLSKQQ